MRWFKFSEIKDAFKNIQFNRTVMVASSELIRNKCKVFYS